MTIELQMLALSVVLGIVHLGVVAPVLRPGYFKWAEGPRDEPAPPLTGVAGRLERAFRNYLETFPFFIAAVLAAHASDTHGWMTEWGAHLYFWARLVYVPLYASGIPLVRSLVWDVAMVGIVLILVAMALN
jgi:uncharacterized MAPEG superfamily protein